MQLILFFFLFFIYSPQLASAVSAFSFFLAKHFSGRVYICRVLIATHFVASVYVCLCVCVCVPIFNLNIVLNQPHDARLCCNFHRPSPSLHASPPCGFHFKVAHTPRCPLLPPLVDIFSRCIFFFVFQYFRHFFMALIRRLFQPC